MLYEAFHCKGLFASAAVGAGKTLVTWLLPLILGAQRPVLLVPASVEAKTHDDFAELKRFWQAPRPQPVVVTYEKLGNPLHALMLCDCAKCTNSPVEPPVPGGLRPDLLIPDEAHRLRNPEAAVTRRIGRYMANHYDTIYACMTGTPWRKSIKNSAPQIIWALKFGAPVPLTWIDMQEWAEALDFSTREAPRDPGALTLLAGYDPKHVETYDERVALATAGFQSRLLSTPGVFQTDRQSCDEPIHIRFLKSPDDPLLDAAFAHFRRTQSTLDGWDIDDAFSGLAYATQLSCGFYYLQADGEARKKCQRILKNVSGLLSSAPDVERLIAFGVQQISSEFGSMIVTATLTEILRNAANHDYDTFTALASMSTSSFSQAAADGARLAGAPRNKLDSALTTITEQAAYVVCSASRATEQFLTLGTLRRVWRALCAICLNLCRPPMRWLDARRAAALCVREKIAASARSGKPLDTSAQVYRAFPDEPDLVAWGEIEPTFQPDTIAMPVSVSPLAYATAWIKANGPALIWVQYDYVGNALSAMSGVPYFASKGLDAGGRDIRKFKADSPAIVSLRSNSVGKNLQGWNQTLVVGPPQAATDWEQGVLGRQHRQGQSKAVYVDVLLSGAENVHAVNMAYGEQAWVRKTGGATGKLLIADYDWSHFPAAELDALPIGHPSRPRWVRPNALTNSLARV